MIVFRKKYCQCFTVNGENPKKERGAISSPLKERLFHNDDFFVKRGVLLRGKNIDAAAEVGRGDDGLT
jgi:hypothetical protein